jgi:hypothetical protein
VALVLLALLGLSRRGRAAGDPTLDWWTIETKHFRVHHPGTLEAVALRVARIAEDVHARLSGPMGFAPDEVTEILLTDFTDEANGSATAVPFDTVRLFVTAPGDMSPLADHDDWQLGLITHEYTHILHTDNVSGIPSVINAVFGKILVPNQLQPRWIIEGLAVVAETAYTSGGRIRSTLFDTYLRADVIADNIAGLDQMSSTARRWPQAAMWYLYGSRFLDWIAQIYGQDALRAVSADYGASLVPWGINRAIRRVTGRTYVELYEGFKDHLRRRYEAQLRQVGRRGLREGHRLTRHGRDAAYPTFAPPGSRWSNARLPLVYWRNDSHERPGHYLLELDDVLGALDRGERPPPLEARLLARTDAAARASFAPDGAMYFSAVVPWRRVYSRSDVMRLPAGEAAPSGLERHRRAVTRGLRALHPSVSPSGRELAFTVNDRGTTVLGIAPLAADGAAGPWRVGFAGARDDQVFTPAFSPDGRHLAFSTWSAGGFRDVRILDLGTGRTARITSDRALDAGPCWSPDGQTLYFSSDRTGIWNVYAYSVADGALAQVTNVRTGAFMPAISPDGRWLVYVGYGAAGWDLYALRLDPARFLEAPPPPDDRPDPPPEAPPVPMRRKPYNPWATLRPHAWSFQYAPGNFESNALTVSTSGSDIAGHHGLGIAVTADPEAEIPQITLDYVYGRLPVDLSVRLANRVVPRADFLINDQRPTYKERTYGMRTGASYDDVHEYFRQSIGIAYSLNVLDADLPVAAAGQPDPYASVTQDPPASQLAFVHVGYGIGLVEGSFDASGPVRGWGLTLGADYGDEPIGSELSFYSGTYTLVAYVPMPWPGWHTLALRTSGGMASGDFARRNPFFVGGFNLENVSTLDVLTSGAFHGAFALRGYPPNAYRGANYLLNNMEYRVPVAEPDRGIETLPIYLRRIDTNFFVDYGGAFNRFAFDEVAFFEDGALVSSPQLHTSAGAEVWLGITFGYGLDLNLRLGYALGFSAEAEEGGQTYFLASGAF